MPKILICLSSAWLLVFSANVAGQTKNTPDQQPDAAKLLKALDAYLAGLKSIYVHAVVTDDTVYADSQKIQYNGTAVIGIKRPGQLFSTLESDYENRQNYLDGGTFTAFDADVNVYTQASVPGDINAALEALAEQYDVTLLGSELFGGHTDELLAGNALSMSYIGQVKIEGQQCHHLAGVLPGMDWQIWIRVQGDPQVCKYVVTDRDVALAPQFSMTFTKWEANTEIPDKRFKFKAPADAEAIELIP